MQISVFFLIKFILKWLCIVWLSTSLFSGKVTRHRVAMGGESGQDRDFAVGCSPARSPWAELRVGMSFRLSLPGVYLCRYFCPLWRLCLLINKVPLHFLTTFLLSAWFCLTFPNISTLPIPPCGHRTKVVQLFSVMASAPGGALWSSVSLQQRCWEGPAGLWCFSLFFASSHILPSDLLWLERHLASPNIILKFWLFWGSVGIWNLEKGVWSWGRELVNGLLPLVSSWSWGLDYEYFKNGLL